MRRFYDSGAHDHLQDTVVALVEGKSERRPIHRLEASLRDPSPPPPLWKMAVVTWLAVNPAVFVSSRLFAAELGKVPALIELLLVNALVVTLLMWLFMPLFTRVARPWLQVRQT